MQWSMRGNIVADGEVKHCFKEREMEEQKNIQAERNDLVTIATEGILIEDKLSLAAMDTISFSRILDDQPLGKVLTPVERFAIVEKAFIDLEHHPENHQEVEIGVGRRDMEDDNQFVVRSTRPTSPKIDIPMEGDALGIFYKTSVGKRAAFNQLKGEIFLHAKGYAQYPEPEWHDGDPDIVIAFTDLKEKDRVPLGTCMLVNDMQKTLHINWLTGIYAPDIIEFTTRMLEFAGNVGLVMIDFSSTLWRKRRCFFEEVSELVEATEYIAREFQVSVLYAVRFDSATQLPKGRMRPLAGVKRTKNLPLLISPWETETESGKRRIMLDVLNISDEIE